MKFRLKIWKMRDGLYLGTCPNLPYCHVDGSDEKEVKTRLLAAIQAYIQSYRDRHEEIPYREYSS